MFTVYDEIRYRQIAKLVSEKERRYRDVIIDQIKAFPKESCLSGDDSVLESFWEEFKFQVQREQSYAFEVYETCIRNVCGAVAEEMPEEEKALLWLFTEEWFDWNEEDVIAPESVIHEALENSFYRRVFETAGDEELVRDPDDEDEEEDEPEVDEPEEEDSNDA